MRIYRVRIIADRYPTEYSVNASSWATALARATREWQQRFKGNRATQLNIKAWKSGKLLVENGK